MQKVLFAACFILFQAVWLQAQPAWVVSGAPIGDTSVYIYASDWAGVSLGLNTGSQDTAVLSNITGNPAGIHLYRVDATPNFTTGLPGGSIRNGVYWGVFPVGGTSPGYDIRIHYGTNGNLTPENEPFITIYKRARNDIAEWDDAGGTLALAEDDILLTESGRQELILDSNIILNTAVFRLSAVRTAEGAVRLDWRATCAGGTGFCTLERSEDGRQFLPLFDTAVQHTPGSYAPFTFIDAQNPATSPRVYYRVRLTDIEGIEHFSNLASVASAADETLRIRAFPNPATTLLNLSIPVTEPQPVTLRLKDVQGRELLRTSETVVPGQLLTIDTHSLPQGVYHLHVLGLNVATQTSVRVLKP